MRVASFLRAFFVLQLLWVGVAQAYPVVPNPDLTQGDICTPSDPDFSHRRYKQQIPYCERNVDYEHRMRIYDLYGIPQSCRKRFTIDHFIPLSIGGNNADENLWPEHKNVKATRPHFEEEVFGAVQTGRMTQDEAIKLVREEKTNPKNLYYIQKARSGGCDSPEDVDGMLESF